MLLFAINLLKFAIRLVIKLANICYSASYIFANIYYSARILVDMIEYVNSFLLLTLLGTIYYVYYKYRRFFRVINIVMDSAILSH